MFYHVNRSEIKVPVPIKEAQLQLLGFGVFTQTRPACVGVPRKSVWRIRDVYPGNPDPDFYPSRIPDLGSWIPDPKTATKERGETKFDVIPFYVATNFTKLYIILVLK
jgi:hypothetical protein